MPSVLTLKNSDKVAIVDDKNYERLSKFVWYVVGESGSIMRSESVGGFIKKYSLASEVMQSYGVMFDHKDRDKLNNLEANLRPCNKAQNAINTDKRVGLSSKYKGVTFDKATGRWKAQIGYNNNIVHLGRFDSQELAAQARDKKAVELFGDFAVLNIPESFQLFAGA